MNRRIETSNDIQPVVPIPQLNLFTRENLQMSIQSVQEVEILPTGNWEDQSELIFNVIGDPQSFVDPSSIRVRIGFKVVNADGSDLVAGDHVAPVANLGFSMFKQVSVRLGASTQISGFDSMYPYVAYVENVLKAPSFVKEQFKLPYFLFPDTRGVFDSFDAGHNEGYHSREIQVAGSIVNYMIVPIHSPITNQDRLLPPKINIQFILSRSSDAFSIMSNVMIDRRNQKVKITSISMTYQKIRVNVALHLGLMEALKQEPAIYPSTHTQCIEFTRVAGTRMIHQSLFSEKTLPSYVYLLVVDTGRRMGSYTLNPFRLQWFDMKEIKLVSGSETYPAIAYHPDRRIRHQMYLDAMQCLGSLNNPWSRSNRISMSDYEGGYGIIAFNLTKGQFPGYAKVTEPPKLGELQLHAQFNTPLTESVSFLLLMEYQSNIYVSSNLEVVTDFMA